MNKTKWRRKKNRCNGPSRYQREGQHVRSKQHMGFRRWLASIKGNEATFYMTYPNNAEWNAKVFKGVIVSTGRDRIVIQEEATGKQFLLLYRNLDYVEIDILFD
ncbi:Spore coat protein GerQ [Paenibacillus curdlanolyticus YK9]|uniref:Spore coat protein GerQ n=1 Tax=Paenibacillus curdlanolyticus YK9 TaxID=717606 RepID=E0IE89_9BACL|nr:Spore coat protein GerQ [Paenibacillus curdlanolyticus YK9]